MATRCFVFVWRSHGSGNVWQSERYAPDAATARARFREDVRGKGRVLYTKEHSCSHGYANGGRFV